VGIFLTFSFIGAVLSDQRKRTLYDAGLYDPYEEEDEVGIFGNVPFSVSSAAFVIFVKVVISLGIEICFRAFTILCKKWCLSWTRQGER
jgi:predicted amidohydrolase